MGSLEDKVARLSQEQRSEAETFIDFLLQKSGSAQPGLTRDPFLASEPASQAAPPIIMADELHSRPVVTHSNDHLPSMGDLQGRDTSHTTDERSYPGNRLKRKDPGLLLDWID
ncbi:MAG: hypothetical protein MUE45_03705 [Methanoregulaceae archaeon]|nr:hypothetical protein [Methanoregulaceae archaeon]MCU0628581.1 hypothetical protein [Methanoregulaceae archaeon]